MLQSTPFNTTNKCLQFNYSNNTGRCANDYENCAEQALCPPENGHHCFVVWNSAQQFNRTPVISAGCNPAYKDAPDEKCMGDCVGTPKGQKGLFYCCCTGHLCNMKYKLPDLSLQSNNSNTSPLLNNTSTHLSDKSLYFFTSIIPHPILLASLMILAFCVYIIWRETTSRKHKLSNNHNTLSLTNHSNNNTPINTTNHKRNKIHKPKPNQSDLTELRNNTDISVLTPLRDEINLQYNHSNIANHQLLNQTTRPPNNNNLDHHHHQHPHANGGDHHRVNHKQLNEENHCDQNLASIATNQQVEPQKIDLSSVKLSELVGTGRYGTVHRATLLDSGREVAVKLLLPTEHQSWLNEKEVYNLTKLKHPNISQLLYSGQDPVTDNYWIIVEFAPLGSVNTYLQHNILNWKDFIRISLGIVHGLSHLHEADVAHRDFKSKNILLRSDLTPCITDFGATAILDNSAGSQLDHKKKYLQVGTPRYMAPEVLECSVTFTKASFTKIDVYALSLVLWELISRCHPLPNSPHHNSVSSETYPGMATTRSHSTPNDYPMHSEINRSMFYSSHTSPDNQIADNIPYRLPFEDVAGKNPDINTMRQIVVVDKYRPPIKEEWRVYPASEFCRAIEDGWEYDHDARISASCFVERVESLPKGA